MNSDIAKLNLPAFDIQLRRYEADGDNRLQVFDPLRGRWMALTPEEWVRQHFVNFLIHWKGYPQSLMANEVSLRFNGMQRRCDTVVYDRSMRPRVIVEYKRPQVVVTQKVFDQIARYNLTMGADRLIVSNGLSHYCCRLDAATHSYEFLRDIPAAAELDLL